MVDSPRAYLSRDQCATRCCLITGVRFELFVIVIFTSIRRTLMAFFAMFRTVFNIYGKHHRCFRSKGLPKRHFYFQILLEIRLITNWISCPTIQEVIVLVFSNRPRALRSSDLEITRAVTP